MSSVLHFLKPLVFLLILLPVTAVQAGAQSYSQQFDALFLKEHPDTVQVKNHLRLWQRFSPEDPQLYVAAFNFYFAQSGREMLSLERSGSTAGDGQTVGTISPHTEYDPHQVNIALSWIDQGISKFPDRLDMWFGKTHVLRLTHRFDSFQVAMQRILDRSVENRNGWYWTNGTPLDSGRQFMLATMQAYLREMYETGRDELLPVMSKLGSAVIAVYPEEVEILSTTAVSFLLQKQYPEAVAYLRRAEHVRPHDAIVLNNLAEAYRQMGDKKTARHYLELVEAYGTAEEKELARRQLKSLKR